MVCLNVVCATLLPCGAPPVFLCLSSHQQLEPVLGICLSHPVVVRLESQSSRIHERVSGIRFMLWTSWIRFSPSQKICLLPPISLGSVTSLSLLAIRVWLPPNETPSQRARRSAGAWMKTPRLLRPRLRTSLFLCIFAIHFLQPRHGDFSCPASQWAS